jgi:hypothetical protein
MRVLLLASLLLCACSLKRGLDVDTCSPENSITTAAGKLGDGAVLYRWNEEVGRAGAPCGKAKDAAACQARLLSLKPTDERHHRERGPGPLVILITKGDDVRLVDRTATWEQLADFGPITQAELWVFFQRGTATLCGGNNATRGAEGVKVLVSTHDGCFGGSDELILVRPNGDTEVLETKQYPQTCVG